MSVSKNDLVALGRELRQRRLDKGISTVTELSNRIGVSRQYLSGLENGYVPVKGPSIPTDRTLQSLAKELDIPISRLHALLGRDPETPKMFGPEAESIAEDFERLPPFGKHIIREALRAVKEAVQQLEREHDPGSEPP